MPEKFWLQDFESGLDRIRVHFITEGGRVVAILVVEYEAYIDGKWRAIVRFDQAHGFFHRDVLSPTGAQEKMPIDSHDLGYSLNEALTEIKQAWQTYRQQYEEVYYSGKGANEPY
jgi:hypothetical protein